MGKKYDTNGDPIRLLYVNDDGSFARLFDRKLSNADPDIEVTTVAGTDEALEAVRKDAVDCVVTAYSVGGDSGIGVVEGVRSESEAVPVVMFTAQGDESVASAATQAGVTDYIPIRSGRDDFGVLANRVRTLTRAARERRRADVATERLERTLERSTEAVYAVNSSWRIEYMNDQMAGRVDRNPEAVVGEVLWEEFPAICDTSLEDEYRTAMESGEPTTFERYLDDPFDYWVRVRAFPDEDGLTVFSRKITEERDQQRRLERSERILENLNDAVLVVDESATVQFANDAAIQAVGVGASGAVEGRTLEALTGPTLDSDSVSDLRGAVDAVLDTDPSGDADPERRLTVEGPSGELRVDLRVSPMSVGGERRAVVAARDVTQRERRERELRRKREFVEKTQEIASIGGWEVDLESSSLRWTDEVYRIHDVPLDAEVSIEEAIDFYHPDDRDTLVEAYERLQREGEPYDLELRIVTDEEAVRWVRTVGDPQFDEEGRVVGVRGIFQDVTERKRRERTLREVKERLDLAVEGANLGIWDWDVDTDAVTFNEQWAEMLGYSLEAIEPTLEAWEKRVHPEDLEHVESQLEPHLAGETELYDCEHRMRTADGDWKWVRDVGQVVERDDDGDPLRAVGIHIDVTERREFQRSLETERNMFAEGPAVVFKWRNENGWPVEYVSENVTEEFGYTPEQLRSGSVPYEELVHDEDLDRVTAEVERNTDDTTERFSHDPYRIVTSEGEVRWVTDNTTIVREGGEVTHYLGYLVDVTDRKRREEELQSIRDRFDRFSSTVRDGFCMTSPDYSETHFVNEPSEAMYGVPLEELEAEPDAWLRHVHPEDRDRLRADVRGQRTDDVEWPLEREFRIQHPDRGLRWIRSRVDPVRDDDGEIIELASISTDITERKRLERSLRDSEASLRELYRIVSNPDLGFEAKLERLLELGRERLDLPFGFLTRIEDGKQTIVDATGSHELLQPGETAPLSESYCRKTLETPGTLGVRDATAEGWEGDPAYDRFELGCYLGGEIRVDGDPYGTLCWAGGAAREREFPESQRAFVELLVQWVGYELERSEIERKLRALQSTAARMAEADSVSAVGEIAVGATADVLGLELTGFWEYDEPTETLEPVTGTEAARELFGEFPTLGNGNSLAWKTFEEGEVGVYDDVRSIEDRHNPDTVVRSEVIVPLGEFGVMTTGSTVAESFSETDVELFRLFGSTVESALARADREAELRRQNDRLDEFASVVAHDLRNPLEIAEGFLEVAEETGDPDHFREVESGLDRIGRLIDDVLALARSGGEIESPERVDVQDAVVEAWGYVDTREATLSTPGDLPVVSGDSSRLVQLFENLFRNAVEHGGSDVTVTVASLEDAPGFYVADDGDGIDPDRRDEVLERGVTTETAGTGYGLSIVADVADAHGWSTVVGKGESGGARFSFRFD